MSAASIEAIQSRQDIRDVLTRYTIALDTRDLDILRTVFTDTTTMKYGDMALGSGVEWFIDYVRGGIDACKATHHMLGQSLIELDGDTANVHTYVTAQHLGHEEFDDELLTFVGWYLDAFARTDDGWRITEREVVVVWSRGNMRVLTG